MVSQRLGQNFLAASIDLQSLYAVVSDSFSGNGLSLKNMSDSFNLRMKASFAVSLVCLSVTLRAIART